MSDDLALAGDRSDQVIRLRRRARRFALAGAILCPCHLPLVGGMLALLGFGGIAAALRDNFVLAFVALVPLTIGAIWVAVNATKAAQVCALPPPPATADADLPPTT